MSQLYCSFCEKSETEVRKLVGGAGGGYICDACVSIAVRVIQDSEPLSSSHSLWQRVRSMLNRAIRGDSQSHQRVQTSAA